MSLPLLKMEQIYIPINQRDESILIKCGCGCGKVLSKYSSKGYLRTYLQGHNNKGKKINRPLGIRHSKESKIKYGKSMKKWWKENKENKKVKERNRKIGISNKRALKGRKLSPKHKEKVIKNLSNMRKKGLLNKNTPKGENHYNWKGGVTKENERRRKQYQWKIWRVAVFKGDKYICQKKNCLYCHNKKGIKLHPHHIKPVSKYPKLIFEVNNGITYCEDFHLKSGLHKNG